jgi:hypothetical protein
MFAGKLGYRRGVVTDGDEDRSFWVNFVTVCTVGGAVRRHHRRGLRPLVAGHGRGLRYRLGSSAEQLHLRRDEAAVEGGEAPFGYLGHSILQVCLGFRKEHRNWSPTTPSNR